MIRTLRHPAISYKEYIATSERIVDGDYAFLNEGLQRVFQTEFLPVPFLLSIANQVSDNIMLEKPLDPVSAVKQACVIAVLVCNLESGLKEGLSRAFD